MACVTRTRIRLDSLERRTGFSPSGRAEARPTFGPEWLADMTRTWNQLQKEQGSGPTPSTTPAMTSAGPSRRHRLITNRLTQGDIEVLVSDFRSGTTIRELAARFSISATTVKSLLRERGVRRAKGSDHESSSPPILDSLSQEQR